MPRYYRREYIDIPDKPVKKNSWFRDRVRNLFGGVKIEASKASKKAYSRIRYKKTGEKPVFTQIKHAPKIYQYIERKDKRKYIPYQEMIKRSYANGGIADKPRVVQFVKQPKKKRQRWIDKLRGK